MAQPSTPARDSSCATPDIAVLLLAWPLFQLMVTSPTAPVMALVIAMLGVILAFSFGPLPPLLSSGLRPFPPGWAERTAGRGPCPVPDPHPQDAASGQ